MIHINLNNLKMLYKIKAIMSFKKKIVFLLTNLGFQALAGYYGLYSIIKHPMTELFNYDEQFLGTFHFLHRIS